MNEHKPIPTMKVGRYAGVPVDQIPNSYLRWVITQDFPADVVECAKRKLDGSEYADLHLNVTRHAIDMFSKRFLDKWTKHVEHMKSLNGTPQDSLGIASFVAKLAQEAWDRGNDVSKHRHQYDGIVKEFEGIRFVFVVSPTFPDYKELVTVTVA